MTTAAQDSPEEAEAKAAAQWPALDVGRSAGPTPWSNWVVPGLLMAGGYPSSLHDGENGRVLLTLLRCGVGCFCCLQQEVSLDVPEGAWRAGRAPRPYLQDARRLLAQHRDELGLPQPRVDWVHLPIVDGHVTADALVSRLADDLIARLARRQVVYIHCWGGHGRTGTVVAVMLARMYGLSPPAALRYTQALHDARQIPQGCRSPSTPAQRAQVRRLLAPAPGSRLPRQAAPAASARYAAREAAVVSAQRMQDAAARRQAYLAEKRSSAGAMRSIRHRQDPLQRAAVAAAAQRRALTPTPEVGRSPFAGVPLRHLTAGARLAKGSLEPATRLPPLHGRQATLGAGRPLLQTTS